MLHKAAAHEYLLEEIEADNYRLLREEADTGQHTVLSRFVQLASTESVKILLNKEMYPGDETFRNHLITYLVIHAPEKAWSLIESDNYGVLYLARLFCLTSFLECIVKNLAPERLRALIAYDDYDLFSCYAAREGNLEFMKLLALHAPDCTQAMIKAQGYGAYLAAFNAGHQDILSWLEETVEPACLAEMKMYFPHARLDSAIDTAQKKYAVVEERITEGAFLWQASKKGYAPVYLFSTSHYIPVDLAERFEGLLDNFLDKVDTLFTEHDVPPMEIRREYVRYPELTSLDELAWDKAARMGKRQKILENRDILFAGLEGLDESRESSESTVSYFAENSDEVRAFYNVYFSNPCLIKSENKGHIEIRNMLWMEAILAESASQRPCLVAVGAAHNLGIYGLPNLLAHEGYALTPLAKTAPPSAKDLLRDLLRGPRLSFFRRNAPSLPTESLEAAPAGAALPLSP